MGTSLRYDGNFDKEKKQLSDINSAVSNELASMKATLEGMPEYWQDEKSAEFIASSNEYIEEIEKKMAEAFEAGNQTLNDVEKALVIYQ